MLQKRLLLSKLLFRNKLNTQWFLKRNSGGAGGTWSYRAPPPMPRKQYDNMATGVGALCWWWIIYHCLTEPGHIFGEFPYKHPSTYTDEELGIPPDSEGPLERPEDDLGFTEKELTIISILI